ncbi:MAG: NAD(P)-dependent oxidoreductase [Lachnospiraceae bacterium]|nr:NAD(P)-dependent oxidoreductase [Lachnospiraceae bacterium]
MKRLDISVDISGRQVFVVGEDDMAMQAVRALLPCGCSITVISERPYPGLESMVKNGLIRLIREPYRREQILDAGMVFACSEKTVNRDIYAACRCLGIPVFTEGEPAKCDFFLTQENAEEDAADTVRDLRLIMSLQKISVYDLVIFTSPAAVRRVMAEMQTQEIDMRNMAGVMVAAVGRETAESLRTEHICPDLCLPAVPLNDQGTHSGEPSDHTAQSAEEKKLTKDDPEQQDPSEEARQYFYDHLRRHAQKKGGRPEDGRILVFCTPEESVFFQKSLREYRTDILC